MPKKSYRVIMPDNPEEAIRLAKNLVAKNTTEADNSPLRALVTEAAKRTLATADQENTNSQEHHRKGEACTANRDIALGSHAPLQAGTVRHFNASARDVLLGHFKGNERALAEWGFTVVAATRHPEEEPPVDEKSGGAASNAV